MNNPQYATNSAFNAGHVNNTNTYYLTGQRTAFNPLYNTRSAPHRNDAIFTVPAPQFRHEHANIQAPSSQDITPKVNLWLQGMKLAPVKINLFRVFGAVHEPVFEGICTWNLHMFARRTITIRHRASSSNCARHGAVSILVSALNELGIIGNTTIDVAHRLLRHYWRKLVAVAHKSTEDADCYPIQPRRTILPPNPAYTEQEIKVGDTGRTNLLYGAAPNDVAPGSLMIANNRYVDNRQVGFSKPSITRHVHFGTPKPIYQDYSHGLITPSTIQNPRSGANYTTRNPTPGVFSKHLKVEPDESTQDPRHKRRVTRQNFVHATGNRNNEKTEKQEDFYLATRQTQSAAKQVPSNPLHNSNVFKSQIVHASAGRTSGSTPGHLRLIRYSNHESKADQREIVSVAENKQNKSLTKQRNEVLSHNVHLVQQPVENLYVEHMNHEAQFKHQQSDEAKYYNRIRPKFTTSYQRAPLKEPEEYSTQRARIEFDQTQKEQNPHQTILQDNARNHVEQNYNNSVGYDLNVPERFALPRENPNKHCKAPDAKNTEIANTENMKQNTEMTVSSGHLVAVVTQNSEPYPSEKQSSLLIHQEMKNAPSVIPENVDITNQTQETNSIITNMGSSSRKRNLTNHQDQALGQDFTGKIQKRVETMDKDSKLKEAINQTLDTTKPENAAGEKMDRNQLRASQPTPNSMLHRTPYLLQPKPRGHYRSMESVQGRRNRVVKENNERALNTANLRKRSLERPITFVPRRRHRKEEPAVETNDGKPGKMNDANGNPVEKIVISKCEGPSIANGEDVASLIPKKAEDVENEMKENIPVQENISITTPIVERMKVASEATVKNEKVSQISVTFDTDEIQIVPTNNSQSGSAKNHEIIVVEDEPMVKTVQKNIKLETVVMNENEPSVCTEAVNTELEREIVIPQKLDVNKKELEGKQVVQNYDSIEVKSGKQESLEEKLNPITSTVIQVPTLSTCGYSGMVMKEK